MKKRLFGAVSTMFVGAAVAAGQSPAVPPSNGQPGAPIQVAPPVNSAPVINGAPIIHDAPIFNGAPITNGSPTPGEPVPQIISETPIPDAADAATGGPGNSYPLFADPDPLAPPTEEGSAAAERERGPGLLGCAWVSGEYLYWWFRNGPNPTPLVTTGPAGSNGVIGAPGTSVLYGGSNIDYNGISGGRFSFGLCESSYEWGMEYTLLYLPSQAKDFRFNSSTAGDPVLARPFTDALLGLQDSLIIASPGTFAGGVIVDSSTSMWGIEANFLRHKRTRSWQGDSRLAGWTFNTDSLLGFRFLNLNEELSITQNSQILPGGVAGFNGARIMSPNGLTILDRFDTTNQFYGGQLGGQAQMNCGRFFVGLIGKVAIGSTYQASNIVGSTALNGPGGQLAVAPGGLLALPTNMGLHNRHVFGVIPEIGVNVGFEITRHIRAYCGYSFLYWNDVLRPGDQVNQVVNKTQVPSSLSFGPLFGPAQPLTTNPSSQFWASGINVGAAVRY